MSEIGIGSTVWVFDENSREYRKNGAGWGSAIYRAHWVPVNVTGENRASWLVGNRYASFSKTRPHRTKATAYGSRRVAVSAQEVDDDCWVNGSRAAIGAMVMRCEDAAILRQIAALVGYKEQS